MTRLQLIRLNERIRNRNEKAFYDPVKNALKTQISSYTSLLREIGPQAAFNTISIDLLNTLIAPIVQKMYVVAGLDKANDSYSKLIKLPRVQKKRRTFGFNDQWTTDILAYFQVHLFDKVVLPISQTTRNYILEIISKGISEGWSIESMLQKIEREDYLDGRVRRILRTEINRAINYGGELARDQFEYKMQKRWVAVHDSRTRHWHIDADGQTVDADGQFLVNGEAMDFPGDPSASGENTINCRCFTEDIAVRDASGSLVPKDGSQPRVRVRGRLRRQLQGILNDLQ